MFLAEFMALIFLNFESTCETDVAASLYDIKTAPRRFDTIHGILLNHSLSLVRFVLKYRNASIQRQREPSDMRLSGADGLICDFPFLN